MKLSVIGQNTLREYAQTDAVLDPQIKASPVTCRRGCTACCSQLLSTTLSEVAAIASSYPKVLLSKRKVLFAQHELLQSLTDRIFGVKRMEINSPETAAEYTRLNELLAGEWWRLKIPCVFLEGNRCTIYDARPVACRGYYVQSPPELCAYAEGGQDVEVVSFGEITKLRVRLAQQAKGMSIMYFPTAALLVINLLRKGA